MPTLLQYRTGFGEQPPFVATRITTGAQATPPAGSYVGTPNTADSRRIIASSDLADTARSASLLDTAADFFDDHYAWIPSLSEQRRVATRSYTDSVDASTMLTAGTTTQIGYVVANRQFAAALAPSLAAELHPILPVLTTDRRPGIHSLINRALRAMRWVRRITFTGNAGNRYSLASYPEITREAQILASYMAESASNTDPLSLFGGASLRWDGNTPYLITGQIQSSSSTFTADVAIPAAAWIGVGSPTPTWAASTVGLVNETDQAMPPVDQVVKVTRYFAFDALSTMKAIPEADRAVWRDERDRAAVIARQFMFYQQPDVVTKPMSVSRLVSIGGQRSWP